jgi:two-component system, sensor histidine kinase RegB
VRDLELITLEVERCQDILQRMSAQGSQGEAESALTLAELAERIRDQLDDDRAHRVDLEISQPELAIQAPRDQLVVSIVALVKNALEASADERVVVKLGGGAGGAEISIVDRGTGIDEDVLSRIGTPFFTTKGSGRGLGLGVFLARAFCESRGGELAIESKRGIGTRAVIHLPVEVHE